LPDGITSIGDGAFSGCTSLVTVDLSNCTGLTSIGNGAFKGAFKGCTSLALISLPDGITSIGDYAFSGCTSLALTSLPESLTSIGVSAFDSCTSLALTSLPNGITTIGAGAFDSCTSLVTVDLSNCTGLTSIGNVTFKGCTSLALTSLPDGITNIGIYAFEGCSSLSTIEFINNATLTTIGQQAFSGCSALETIDFTNCTALTNIGNNAFQGVGTATNNGVTISFKDCAGVTSLNNTFRNAKVKSVDLRGTSIEAIPNSFFFFGNNTTLESVLLPSTVKTIGTSAFRSQMSLANVNFGELTSLESIGDNAFNGCDHLTEIDFSSSILEQVGASAFANCYSITAIKLPASVTSIGNKAFFACPNLTEIEATGSATLGTSVFSPSDYVPSGVNVFYNYYLDGTYHSYEVPIRTTLTGDADWFDTYDFKGDYRVMGDYTVTLPMSIELKYNGTDFGTTEYEVANDTNDWPIMVSLWDTSNPYHSGSLNMSDESGHTIKLLSSDITYNTDWSDSVGKFTDKTGEKTITFTSNEVITSEIAYTGSLTFKTGIIVE